MMVVASDNRNWFGYTNDDRGFYFIFSAPAIEANN